MTHEPTGFVVRYLDGSGREHQRTFDTKREARYFAHQFGKHEPAAYDSEIDWLNAENVGCFVRNAGPSVDVYRHENDPR